MIDFQYSSEALRMSSVEYGSAESFIQFDAILDLAIYFCRLITSFELSTSSHTVDEEAKHCSRFNSYSEQNETSHCSDCADTA